MCCFSFLWFFVRSQMNHDRKHTYHLTINLSFCDHNKQNETYQFTFHIRTILKSIYQFLLLLFDVVPCSLIKIKIRHCPSPCNQFYFFTNWIYTHVYVYITKIDYLFFFYQFKLKNKYVYLTFNHLNEMLLLLNLK